ncbi:MAG TPA: peptide deformylase [bacterium]|nr:peptide deformylase [bacterium]
MKQPIVKIGHPVLRRKISNIPLREMRKKTFLAFLNQMALTMRRAQGVGLAANQVGENRRAFVMECHGNKRYPRVASFPLQAYVNARIVEYSKSKVNGWEGCLSIPGFRGLVPRSTWVTFEAQTPGGLKIRKTVRGFEARVVQHEIDHLNGFFYIDRMKDWKSWMHLEQFNRHFKARVRDRK